MKTLNQVLKDRSQVGAIIRSLIEIKDEKYHSKGFKSKEHILEDAMNDDLKSHKSTYYGASVQFPNIIRDIEQKRNGWWSSLKVIKKNNLFALVHISTDNDKTLKINNAKQSKNTSIRADIKKPESTHFNFADKIFWEKIYKQLKKEIKKLFYYNLIKKESVHEAYMQAKLYQIFSKKGFLVQLEADILDNIRQRLDMLVWNNKLGSAAIEIKKNVGCFNTTRYTEGVKNYHKDIKKLVEIKEKYPFMDLIFIEMKFIDYNATGLNTHLRHLDDFESKLKTSLQKNIIKLAFKDKKDCIFKSKNFDLYFELTIWIKPRN